MKKENLNINKSEEEELIVLNTHPCISQYNQDFEVKREIREWFKALISMMNDAKINKSGHLPLLITLIKDVNDLHHLMLESDGNQEYKEIFSVANPHLKELKLRSGNTEMNDIEVGLNSLYGFLLLKIQLLQLF